MQPGPADCSSPGYRYIDYGLIGRSGELGAGISNRQVTREPWQDRWFQERPQLRGAVPRYPERADPEDIGSLPMYRCQADRASLVLQRSESREPAYRLDNEAASELRSIMDGMMESSSMVAAV
jgi:hypothetical protein